MKIEKLNGFEESQGLEWVKDKVEEMKRENNQTALESVLAAIESQQEVYGGD